MRESEIKESISKISISDAKKDKIFENIMNNSKDEKFVQKQKRKSFKTFCDRYVAYAAAFTIFVGLFAVYGVNTELFGTDNTVVIDYTGYTIEEEEETARNIDASVFTAYVPSEDGFSETVINLDKQDITSIWDTLVEQEVYPSDVKLLSTVSSGDGISMVFSAELANYENLSQAIEQSFSEYFTDYDSVEVSYSE